MCTYILSRDSLFLTRKSCLTILKQFTPKQTPEKLVIKQLPKEIFLWVELLLLRMPVQKQRLVKPKPSKLLIGVAGTISCSKLVLISICFLKNSRHFIKTPPSPPFLGQLEMQPLVTKIKSLWFNQSSRPPSHM